MAAASGGNWRAVKRHRNYTVEEVARTLGRGRGTIRRWIADGLPALTDRKPFLILGEDLIAFLKARRRPRARCGPGEFYCFRCRVPRRAALEMAEIVDRNPSSVNLRALCAVCETLMHRRVAIARLAPFAAGMEVSGPQAPTHIGEPAGPCVDDHFDKEPQTHA
ncbi:helix-turn-helix domain-containing protein [Minwuia thermotolerans]|uniref:DNA-binding protein n=1 Tax=Minwuia thermotolerans TaxID=2056226 RepID=A0A2M9G6K7_9PROT|nr:helix-turn-helix domain-containing protein [Minwuia thermotolerans]PJK31340.1 DNA-binding protein [Minwuia thermotolerans]